MLRGVSFCCHYYLVSLSYSLRSSPSYVIGYCTEGSSTLHTINVMQPCNLSSPIQCDRHLMTVHASSISLLLPCAESILFLWFPQKATPIASSHTIPCFLTHSFVVFPHRHLRHLLFHLPNHTRGRFIGGNRRRFSLHSIVD